MRDMSDARTPLQPRSSRLRFRGRFEASSAIRCELSISAFILESHEIKVLYKQMYRTVPQGQALPLLFAALPPSKSSH